MDNVRNSSITSKGLPGELGTRSFKLLSCRRSHRLKIHERAAAVHLTIDYMSGSLLIDPVHLADLLNRRRGLQKYGKRPKVLTFRSPNTKRNVSA